MDNLIPVVSGLVGMLVTLVCYVFITTIQDLKRRVVSLEEEDSVPRRTYIEGISKLEKAFKDDIGALEKRISTLVDIIKPLSDWKVYEEGRAAAKGRLA